MTFPFLEDNGDCFGRGAATSATVDFGCIEDSSSSITATLPQVEHLYSSSRSMKPLNGIRERLDVIM